MKSILYILLLLIFSFSLHAQNIRGKVEEQSGNKKSPLIGANVHWSGTSTGTITDEKGEFSLKASDRKSKLVVSYIGYVNDTIEVRPEAYYSIVLKEGHQLDGVTIKASATSIDQIKPVKTEIISSKELQKAACCNLSESFETNASVDVSFTDAVSGAKQIQMLGLDGTYSQILIENIPGLRGISTAYGLNYIPGTWIESIDLGKGAGSVLNGYESISGQINVELKKPENSELFFVNTYVNSMGRLEANVTSAIKLNDKWSSALLLHSSNQSFRVNMNGNGFMDTPLFTQLNMVNRYKYEGERFKGQIGVKALVEDRMGGQVDFQKEDRGSALIYGLGGVDKRYEVFGKAGILFPDTPYKGLGFIASGIIHDKEAYFGLNNYRGVQKTLYTNLIYQTIIGNTFHQVKTGASFVIDEYDEMLNEESFARKEIVPGFFGEYSYSGVKNLMLVPGFRIDFHNMFGVIYTPRLHAKYDIGNSSSIRASAGRGFRMPNAIAENLPLLISSRRIHIEEDIMPEIAWNFGLSYNREFNFFDKRGAIDLEFFRTDFENQLIADRDTRADLLRFYNLKGRSVANSYQAEMTYELLHSFDVKVAYKRYDVKATINDELRAVPMIARDRLFLNLGYASKFDIWKFDLTTKWTGTQRIPLHSGMNNSMEEANSPSFITINGQVTKSFRKWDLYVGVENATNFRIHDPIIGAADPFGNNFDASLIWGPVIGRMFYAGMRWGIN
jgi:outer membrane receptor for ferrienterochelin and colicins